MKLWSNTLRLQVRQANMEYRTNHYFRCWYCQYLSYQYILILSILLLASTGEFELLGRRSRPASV